MIDINYVEGRYVVTLETAGFSVTKEHIDLFTAVAEVKKQALFNKLQRKKYPCLVIKVKTGKICFRNYFAEEMKGNLFAKDCLLFSYLKGDLGLHVFEFTPQLQPLPQQVDPLHSQI